MADIDITGKLQHPRRSLGNRHRSQAEKFLKISENNENISWAEQSAKQAVLYDFTNPENWQTLTKIKILKGDENGVRAVLEELFTILGRDPELLNQLKNVDLTSNGMDLLHAGLEIDPLDPDKWAKNVLGIDNQIENFKHRVETLDLRDVRANVLFSRRIERLRDNGDEELFIHLSRILLAQRPSNHETWNELGKLHERRAEYDEAWFCYDQAQTYFPTLQVRDRYKKRMEAKMDGEKIIPWKEPIVKNRVEFLRKMQNMATPKNYVENLDAEDNEEKNVDIYQRIANLREKGNLSGAFFLSRQLAAEGNEMGTRLVKEIMEEMTDEN
jgi:tetratricopeptide (TPR) repeat protein|tara:strand:- start:8043 stop:9026 length:984 start_codon:yes stop_codon:yes gene_type:complete